MSTKEKLSMHSEYQMVINWSKEDNCYFAVIPDLPGCFGDGETREECVKNTEVINHRWMDRNGYWLWYGSSKGDFGDSIKHMLLIKSGGYTFV